MDRRVAAYRRLRVPVLLQGPPGCGKSHLARHGLHAAGPFVRVNGASLVGDLAVAELFGCTAHAFTGASDRRGKLGEAHGGTLFLDEAHALEPRRQQLLTTWLDDGRYHRLGEDTERTSAARLVLASYQPAAAWMVPDLRSRIGPHVITVSPPSRVEVRARLEARLRELAPSARVADAAWDLLLARPNPRDAVTALEAALVSAVADDRRDVGPDDVSAAEEVHPRDAAARSARDVLLASAGGSVTGAARLAGVSRSTFYRRYGAPGRGDPTR